MFGTLILAGVGLFLPGQANIPALAGVVMDCLLYTSDAADE